jgi:hypothetical protein
MIRVPPAVKIVIGVTLLAVLGATGKALLSPGPPSACIYSCSRPPVGIPRPAGVLLSRHGQGFEFTYPSGAQLASGSPTGVTTLNYADTDGSFNAEMAVTAGTGPGSLDGLINSAAARLGRSEVSNLQRVGSMPGAEIGFVAGAGALYEGDYSDSTGYQYPVKVGIVAVQHGRHWVTLVGISTESASDHSPLSFGMFDDVLARWRWVD